MLVPFTKAVKEPGDASGIDEDDEISDDEDDDGDVEGGREEFDDAVVEEAIEGVNAEFGMADAEVRTARSSLTKASIHTCPAYCTLTCAYCLVCS